MLSLAPYLGIPDEIWSESSDSFPILEVVDIDLVFDLSQRVRHFRTLRYQERSHVRLSCTR